MSKKVTPIGAKADRLGHQLNLHEALREELRASLNKYKDLGLMQVFISDAFCEVDSEGRIGPLALIEDHLDDC